MIALAAASMLAHGSVAPAAGRIQDRSPERTTERTADRPPGRTADRTAGQAPTDAPIGRPIRLAVIEGFSGAFADAGASVWRNLQFATDRINDRGGVRFAGEAHRLELVRYDSQGQPEAALIQLNRAADEHVTFVLQGNGSAVAAALVEAVERHNRRDPAHRMLYLNYAAVDPSLTNEACSFWHFRFDANIGMRMTALIDALSRDRLIHKVYLIDQDYSFGRQFARLATEAIHQRRPDIDIVADELHPLGRIKDFAPYAAKIRASGADAVVTGNWGNDLALLVRAARDAGLQASFYTFYGNSLGAPQAIGEAGVGRVYAVSEWHPDAGIAAGDAIYDAFLATLASPRDDYFNMRHVLMIDMLARAIERAGSDDAAAVARALEGLHDAGPPYAVTMRATDHQLLTPQYVTVMDRIGLRVHHDIEHSGYGFRTVRYVPADETALPTTCHMHRP